MDWTEADRKVFRYFDGLAERWGDPIDLYERLVLELGESPQKALDAARHGLSLPQDNYPTEEAWQAAKAQEDATAPARVAAVQRLREAVRRAFEMAPFDPAAAEAARVGATASDVDAALDSYFRFLDGQKKSGAAPLT